MTELYKGMTERDLLIKVATRQDEMTAHLERMDGRLEVMNSRVLAHDRAISRIQGIGGAAAILYAGAMAVLGWFLRR